MKPVCEECKKELSMNDQLQQKRVAGNKVCVDCFAKHQGGVPLTGGESAKPEKEISAPLNRYKDAYVHSKAIKGIGSTVKGTGVILAAVICVGAFSVNQPFMVTFAVAGLVVYGLGILISSAGQIHEAVLDTAVTSSPFLTKEEMKRVMSL